MTGNNQHEGNLTSQPTRKGFMTLTKNTITVYTEVNINPASGGFGMFERGLVMASPENSWADLSYLESLLEGLGYRKLDEAIKDPEFIAVGVENIAGRIHNQPPYIFARIAGSHEPYIEYCGIEASEVPADFYEAGECS